MDILKHIVDENEEMRRVLLSALMDVEDVEQHLIQQNVLTKFGGRISDYRWKTEIRPMFQDGVSCIDCMCIFKMYTIYVI